jgi:hypothetical protein
MRGDALVETQRLIAQAINALAEHIEQSSGFYFTPVLFEQLPSPAKVGMVACIEDSTTDVAGGIVGAGGPHTVLAFYNGTVWKAFTA